MNTNPAPARRAIAAALLSCLALALGAAPLALKLASPAPQNTPWGQGLERLRVDWAQVSGGQVELRVYHGGSYGDSAGVRQKMDIGTLDAGVFDSMGLSLIAPEILALSMPSLIRTDAELDYVLEKMGPWLSEKLAAKGYTVLAWSRSGWIRFFSKKQILVPEDLKRQKLGVNPNATEIQQAFKLLNYNIVPMALTGVVQGLGSGVIDAFYTSPLMVASQWTVFARGAPYMLDRPVCPFVGAILIRQSSWAKVDPALKDKLLASLLSAAKAMDRDLAKKEADAIAQMKANGLVVQPLNAAEVQAWVTDFETGMDKGLGRVFPQEAVDRVVAALAEYRKTAK